MKLTQFIQTIVTEPTNKILDLASAKNHLRVDAADDDVDIGRMINGVAGEIVDFLRRPLLETEISLKFSDFGRYLYLPLPNILSVESIKYYQVGVLEAVTFPSDFYQWENAICGPVITLKGSRHWPNVDSHLIAPITATVKAGFGAEAASIPPAIIDAAYMLLADRYDNRGYSIDENQVVSRLLNKHRYLG